MSKGCTVLPKTPTCRHVRSDVHSTYQSLKNATFEVGVYMSLGTLGKNLFHPPNTTPYPHPRKMIMTTTAITKKRHTHKKKTQKC